MLGLLISLGLAAQLPSSVPLVHLHASRETVLRQTGACAGRAYDLVFVWSASGGVTVRTFSVDGVVWNADQLAAWNRELAALRGDVVASFECMDKGDAVRMEGWTDALGPDVTHVAVTALGGGGRWFGFEQARFQQTIKLTGVETRRAP